MATAVAPTIGGLLLVAAGWRSVFVVMAGLGVTVMLVTALAMRETVAADRSRLKAGALIAAYARVLGDRRFLVAAGIVSCAIGALYAQATFLPFILMGRVGLSPAEFGLGMLFQSGSFLLGSPGGPGIILFNLKAIIALLDWHLDPQAATALANFGSTGGPFLLEPGQEWDALADGMAKLGHQVQRFPFTSGLAIIAIAPEGFEGGADPRREGVALGD